MNEKVKCQIVSLLLNDESQLTENYNGAITSQFDFQTIMEEYYLAKGMNSIRIDPNLQAICFTSQKEPIQIYNINTKHVETYYEEIHISCANLKEFMAFKDFLEKNYNENVYVTNKIPNQQVISSNKFLDYKLVMEPINTEVNSTKKLVSLLSQKSDEEIFRAIAIHYGKMVDNINEIDMDLVQSLNQLYNSCSPDSLFFSKEIADKIVNMNNQNENIVNIANMKPKAVLQNENYTVTIDDDLGFFK